MLRQVTTQFWLERGPGTGRAQMYERKLILLPIILRETQGLLWWYPVSQRENSKNLGILNSHMCGGGSTTLPRWVQFHLQFSPIYRGIIPSMGGYHLRWSLFLCPVFCKGSSFQAWNLFCFLIGSLYFCLKAQWYGKSLGLFTCLVSPLPLPNIYFYLVPVVENSNDQI